MLKETKNAGFKPAFISCGDGGNADASVSTLTGFCLVRVEPKDGFQIRP